VFGPIAVVGQACVLPGALRPEQLWSAVLDGRDLLTAAPPGRWRIDPELVLAEPGDADEARDRCWSDRGGYVRGFEAVFDPQGFALAPEQVLALDPLFHWTLHAGREALRDAGHDAAGGAGRGAGGHRVGAVLGNLSFPSSGLSAWAESVWLGDRFPDLPRPDPLNRFMSGLPAHLLAGALGLDAGAFALDAACASFLYALKLACDRLHDGRADLMLAGAVNRADDLFLHIGFTALRALSRSGLSRPLHRDSDGLVPAEGAVMLALKRLGDAVAAGDRVLAVIRGVGLANDGRGAGLLAPAEEGQVRAMRAAYAGCGLEPGDVTLLECHATGTPVGDATEVRSTAQVFAGTSDVPIGSVKSNLGHLVTAAGGAGLLKVIAALRAGVRPPTRHADAPIAALAASPFRLLREAEPWPAPGTRRARCAAVSAFGFGGNNAHLLVEEWTGEADRTYVGVPPRAEPAGPAGPAEGGEVAVVGLGAVVADLADAAAFARALFTGDARLRPGEDGAPAAYAESVRLNAAGLRFPPRDLEQASGQQLLVLRAAREAVEDSGVPLPRERTAVLVGMACDAEVARAGARWRLAGWLAGTADAPGGLGGPGGPGGPDLDGQRDGLGGPGGPDLDGQRDGLGGPGGPDLDGQRDGICPPLTAAGTVGAMPNVVANRLNSEFDLAGPSFAVSAEELSGLVALGLAARALRAGGVDAAVVGAVDVSVEPAHGRAAEAVLDADRRIPGDAAVVLVLRRLADARRDGNRVLAVLPPTPLREEGAADAGLRVGLGEGHTGLTALFGHAHAASGLLHAAAAVLACRHAALPPGVPDAPARPWLPASPSTRAGRLASVAMTALGGQSTVLHVRADDASPPEPLALGPVPRLHVFSGDDRAGVIRSLVAGRQSREGPARLAVVAGTGQELAARLARAQAFLERGAAPGDGVYFRERPIRGELAYVFAAPAGAYRGMGRELLLARPDLVGALASRFRRLREAAGWVYVDGPGPTPEQQLSGSSMLCQLHAELTRGVLGLAPQAAIGISAGETNALFALRAWDDIDGLFDSLAAEGVYTRELAGEFSAVRRAWGVSKGDAVLWTNWRVLAPLDAVRAALDGEPRAHLTIVNAPGDAVIGGDAAACRRVVQRVGPRRARPLGYDIAVHCPELGEFRDAWRRIHHRPTAAVPGVRFYTHATCAAYRPDADSAAEALLGQALRTVDFPRLVERAWADGVRVFLEHGPQGAASGWISRILGEREHLAVPLDVRGEPALRQAVNAVASLVAAGVDVDCERLLDGLGPPPGPRRPAPPDGPALTFRVHRPPVAVPAQLMPPAPAVVSVFDDGPDRPAVPADVHTGQVVPVAVRQLVAGYAQVTAVHRRYLGHLTEAHRRFLALRPPDPPLAGAGRPAYPAAPTTRFPGPSLDRAQLEALASGPVSAVLGPLFAGQDGYRRQVRLPEPPLLLADRVLGIEGGAGSMGRGTIWTETDVAADSWYLHDGHLPAGIMIEAGQADLLLISWLGVDLLNRGERVYRLLGCELTFHGGLPAVGDTLRYDIHVDGHAEQGGVRLFFFHYDCVVGGMTRLTVRGGQAGFFTDEELGTAGGVLWDAAADPRPQGRLDPPAVRAVPGSLDRHALAAFAAGRVPEAFGAGFELAQTQVRPPRIAAGRMLLLHEVERLDPAGGPWGRGYLKARWRFTPDDWFFAGHFKDDPCMPGTLIFEGCLQAMSVYLTALGHTLERDGWRFEPVAGETFRLRCRGQATPAARELVYEVFVEEVAAGPVPTLHADVLCTVDGVKAFHGRRLGLRLAPDWPLPARPVPAQDGVPFDERSILACALGRPSEAFGAAYRSFDGPRRLPRLPGPPYLFLSRVTTVEGELGTRQAGTVIETEYDVPAGAWYFDRDGHPAMPFCVLLEAMLQPCGWLAVATGVLLGTEQRMHYRNLDGTGTLLREVRPGDGPLRTRVRLLDIAASADMWLMSFDATGWLGDEQVVSVHTGFGFFPSAALRAQAGLPTGDEDRHWLARPTGAPLDLAALAGDETGLPAPSLPHPSSPAGPRRLLLFDRVTGWWPAGGRAGLGRIRAEKEVDPGEWFFKAHFYQDPVQPGSLGVEAMLQLAKVVMLASGSATAGTRFEPLAAGQPLSWRYRGQVVPAHRRVVVELEVTRAGRDARGAFLVADGWLWADGTRIYAVRDLGMRAVAG
jgi:acyl transferase domain-containing protein/3-hydroxymyristoyl/3-hydroxydecanoyl-(acyl carrier protein) dehydratase